MDLFNYDNPWFKPLGTLTDLMWLNVWAMLYSIPIVTAGAAVTASHYVAYKLRNGECESIRKEFQHSFKENFKQSTILWIAVLVIAVFLGCDFYAALRMKGTEGVVLQILVVLAAFFCMLVFVWLFPLQAKFENTPVKMVFNSFILGMSHIFRTILMIILSLLPVALIFWEVQGFLLLLALGFSGPAYFCCGLYKKVLEELM